MVEETALITAAQKGELGAFNQLILQYQSLAYNVAYRILGEADAAADVTQETFIKAFKSIRQYRGGSFKAWLLRIVTNACYDQLRVRQRRPTSSLEELMEDPEHPIQLLHDGERPEEYVLRSELSDVIQAGIAALPEEQRTVLILCDIEGLSYQEVVEVTGAEMGTVKSRLSRGRARLRDFLRAWPELLPSRYRLKSRENEIGSL
jgi:RNA polymerase sigma-70 factor (ECF subfamily)